MNQSALRAIRNIAMVGHTGSGKTSLAEAMLAAAGSIPQKGSVEKGTTVCDYDSIEKQFGHSLQTALVNFSWQGAPEVFTCSTGRLLYYTCQSSTGSCLYHFPSIL